MLMVSKQNATFAVVNDKLHSKIHLIMKKTILTLFLSVFVGVGAYFSIFWEMMFDGYFVDIVAPPVDGLVYFENFRRLATRPA